MRNKSDALFLVPRFFKLVETQFVKVIKCFRSDNAPELKFTDFFASIGTTHQFSCAERPQQNPVVERKHQHLLNVARALFFQSHVPLRFWGECVLTACYIVNIIPMLCYLMLLPLLFCTTKRLIIPACTFSVAFAMHQPQVLREANLTLELLLAYFLAILLDIKATDYMILKNNTSLFHEMLFSSRKFFLFETWMLMLMVILMIFCRIMFSPHQLLVFLMHHLLIQLPHIGTYCF